MTITTLKIPSETKVGDHYTEIIVQDEIQDLVDHISRREILLNSGDWKARTQQSDEYTQQALRKFDKSQSTSRHQ